MAEAPGRPVKRGDIIAVVDTQKGAIEIEVFEDGVLDQIIVQPGEKVPVGTVLALIRGLVPNRWSPACRPDAQRAAVGRDCGRRATIAGAGSRARTTGRVRVSPMARKLAADLGVDLANVTGTGSQGAITREDVERAAVSAEDTAAQRTVAPPADRTAAMRAPSLQRWRGRSARSRTITSRRPLT